MRDSFSRRRTVFRSGLITSGFVIRTPLVQKLQLEDREAVQRRIRDRDALPHEQLANLGRAEAITQPALDQRALLDTSRPPVAARSPTSRMQREERLTDGVIADRGGHVAGRRGRLQIAADRLGASPSWAAMRFFGRPAPRKRRTSLTSIIVTSRYIHASWPRSVAREPETSIARSGERREGFENLAPQRGKRFENLTPEGGKVLKKSSGKGP